FLDTPGIVPEGRLYDILCSNCQKRVIPSKKLSGKVFLLREGRSLMLGGLVILSIKKGKFLLKPFISCEIPLHETNEVRFREILQKGVGEWLVPPCKGCIDKIESKGWEGKLLAVRSGQDIAISGIGWVSIFRGEGDLFLNVPEGVKVTLRNSIRR
ncbi:MAG: hypothetical protein J7M13_03825, partial [Synergistetes bacterium]|nr:hypothetical protein [Synergistota bacterium]